MTLIFLPAPEPSSTSTFSSLAPGAAARVDFSRISGWSDATFTLTVSGSQTNGSYALAGGATGFNKTISVVNTSGTQLGTLTVGRSTVINGVSCTLNLNSGSLSVSVARTVSNQDSLSCPGVVFSGGNADSIAIAASEQPAASSGITAEWEMLATGDFNADGKADTLWRNSFVGEDGSWYSAYCTKLASEENDWHMVGVANAAEWNFLGSGDFNADGTDDIAWCNPEIGLAGFWQIENRELASWHTASGGAAVRC